MNKVGRTIRALELASFVCLKMRYAHYPSCCVEASAAGAEALRRKGLSAKAVHVIGMVATRDLKRAHWLGATPREIYDIMLKIGSGAPLTFEEFLTRAVDVPDSDEPLHMVIEVEARKRQLIDLTVGQARMVNAPSSVVLELEGAGALPQNGDNDQLHFSYFPPTRALEPKAASYKNEGLTQDMIELMGVALRCDLDVRAFHRAVEYEFEVCR